MQTGREISPLGGGRMLASPERCSIRGVLHWRNAICCVLEDGVWVTAMVWRVCLCDCCRDILALDCGQRLEDEQVANPRLYKSHESWEKIPKVRLSTSIANYQHTLCSK